MLLLYRQITGGYIVGLSYFILLLTIPFLLTAKEVPAFTGKISGNKVRLRSSPHLNSAVIGELNKDDYVKVIGEQAGFLVIEPPSGMKMYVYRTYVFNQIVDTNNVNVRLSPSLESPTIAQLHAGEKIVGKPSSQNPKWLEIDPPTTAKLYIAKEYVIRAGGEDFLKEQIEKLEKANILLLSTYRDAENELKKPTEDMLIEPLIAKIDSLKETWHTLPEHEKHATALKELLEESSKNKKVAALEAKIESVSAALEARKKKSDELQLKYEMRIQQLENKLHDENSQLIASLEAAQLQNTNLSLPNNEGPSSKWQMIEQSYQNQWLSKQPALSAQEYQKFQSDHAVNLHGVIKSYEPTTNNAPGDFILLINGLPCAFLYSPFVDLSIVVDKEISLTAVERDNHYFAYPSYCVMQVKMGPS